MKVDKIGEQTYILLEDLKVYTPKYEIIVKKGFDFDSASIPQVFWSIIGSPFTGNYVIPACIHDALYASEILPRKECDEIFLYLMKQYAVGYVKRYAMYYAVRAGGWKVWKDHNKDEVNKYKGFIDVKVIE